MIGNQCVEQSDKETDAGTNVKQPQRIDKITYAIREESHLKNGVKGERNQHTSCQLQTYGIEQFDQQGVDPGVVVAVRNYMQYLFELIKAVRRHDPRILIEKIGEPANDTE